MTILDAGTRGETATVSPALMVVLRGSGLGVCSVDERPDLELDLPRLSLIQGLAGQDGHGSAELVADIATGAPATAEELSETIAELSERGWLLDGSGDPGSRSAAPTAEDPGDAPAAGYDPSATLVVQTPLVLRVASAGFEVLDHWGRLRIRMPAAELAAASELRRPSSVQDALDRHRASAGPAALDDAAFSALLDRLTGAGLLSPYDPGGPDARENLDARAIMVHLKRFGAAVDRAVKAHESSEREREARTGTTRFSVTPVDLGGSPIPLALGMIFAHAQAHDGGRLSEHYQFVPEWLTRPPKVNQITDHPGVYLFSNYVWNHHSNLAVSETVKQRSPSSVTIHGGPDTPKYEQDVTTYFRVNPHVDVAVHGEGEVTTTHVLDALAGVLGDGPPDLSVLGDVPGLSFRNGDRVVRTPDRARLTELDSIPSPFLTGVFDAHAEAGVSMAIIETNRGCPYGCTFCDWGSATASRIRKFDLDHVFQELEWCARHQIGRVFLADANFGIFERDAEIAEKVAELKGEYGYPKLFSTNYAKNTIKHVKRIVQALGDAGVLTQGLLSLQSMDAGTLDTVHRSNIKLERYEELAREFRKAKLPLFVDLMLGLPGATRESFQADLQSCIDRDVTAKIYPTELLVNSPMNDRSYRDEHQIQTAAPLGELVKTSRTPEGSSKRSLVVSTSTFTRADYQEMLGLRRAFLVSENLGALRQVARFVRQEHGTPEVELYERLRLDARARPDLWPAMDFTFRLVPMIGAAPVSWSLLLDEVHRYLTEVLGLADDASLSTALSVQHALLPSRGRQFPYTLQLAHDYAAWHRAILEAKDGGNHQWELVVPRLGELGPGPFVVEDPNEVCDRGIGFQIDINAHAAWELASPVERAVSHEHLETR